jgi:Ca2+-binding RTX toxin-like protein
MPVLQGGAASDTLTGSAADDEIRGDLGDDRIDGVGGNDLLVGGPGNDVIGARQNGGSAVTQTTIDGGDGNDTIYVGSVAQSGGGFQRATVTAGAGDDEINIFGDHVSGVFDGGEGSDRFNVMASVDEILVRLGPGGADVVTYEVPTVVSPRSVLAIEGFQTGDSGDVLNLSLGVLIDWDHSNPFAGGYLQLVSRGADAILQVDVDGGGDDFHDLVRIVGTAAPDFNQFNLGGYSRDGSPPPGKGFLGSATATSPVTIFGDKGGDTIVAQASVTHHISGAAGNDRITGQGARDNIHAGYGDDTVDAGGGNDWITDDYGTNRLRGQEGDDTISGGLQFDHMRGDAGDDQLSGDDGGDIVVGGAGRDVMTGGDGADLFVFAAGDSGVVQARADVITDWSRDDAIAVGRGSAAGGYLGSTQADFAQAAAFANERIGAGVVDYVAVAVGQDLVVFIDSRDNNGTADDAVILSGRGLADIAPANLIAASAGDQPLPQAPLSTTPSAGPDRLVAKPGASEIHAGAGDDTLRGGTVSSYLRGDDGADSIMGGDGFDDINGNMGNDRCFGGLGDDWVVGGKDNDSLYGEGGRDLVYGNLGDDFCNGGEGDDILRGGQGNDLVYGGAGADYISGDRGEDTMVGNSGADIYHSFGEAGLDLVLGFSRAEGDRVLLDAGTQYEVAQVGADTVITMVGGGRMVLFGVSLAFLDAGWITVG